MIDGDGMPLFEDGTPDRIRRLEPTLGPATVGTQGIASADGREVWFFDESGRHLRTVDGLTGATLLEFGYDAAGRLLRAEDADGRKTLIERNAAGAPTAIVAPDGRRTLLGVNAAGRLCGDHRPDRRDARAQLRRRRPAQRPGTPVRPELVVHVRRHGPADQRDRRRGPDAHARRAAETATGDDRGRDHGRGSRHPLHRRADGRRRPAPDGADAERRGHRPADRAERHPDAHAPER